MAKSKRKKQKIEPDSVFFLKILLFMLLGVFWVRIVGDGPDASVTSLPVGLFVGLIFASHDHFQIDRKIEYAVLLIAFLVSFYIPVAGFWV